MEIFYFGENSHRLFGVLHRPRGRARIGLVICPPFGEEMTLTYSRFAIWAKQLAEQEIAVLRFHSYGVGESEGSFSDFTLDTAIADTVAAVRYLREQAASEHIGLFGLRFGGSIAVRAGEEVKPDCLLLWCPIINLGSYANDLLRLRLTAGLIHQRTDGARATREAMLDELKAGRCVDILGWELSPTLYLQMTCCRSWPENPPAPNVLWLARPTEQMQADPIVAAWKARGCRADVQVYSEPVFWEERSPVIPHQFANASLAWMTQTLLQPGAVR